MLVSDISIGTTHSQAVLSAAVTSPALGKTFELWFRAPARFAAYLSDTGDPFVACLWPIASSLGEDLAVTRPVSPKLKRSLPQVTEILRCWGADEHPFRLVRLSAPDGALEPPQIAARAASFFSLGVDSTYTLIKHAGGLDHLILLRSFDTWPWSEAESGEILAATASLLSHLHRAPEPILLDTNLRALSDRFLDWTGYLHGAALSATALALSGGISLCFIPATFSYRHLIPWGSHPVLDPLWSTPSVQIVHDGCESTRVGKILTLAQAPFALKRLRVCNSPVPGRFNCGRCNKCLRTMIGLSIAGALGQCETLPAELDLQAVRNMRVEGVADRIFLEEIAEVLRRPGADRALREAVEEVLGAARMFAVAREKTDQGDYAGAIPILEELRRLVPNSPEVPYLLGFCFLQQRTHLDRALLLLDTALERGFSEFWVRYARASLNHALRRQADALADARRAFELDPSHAGARELLEWFDGWRA